MVRRLRFPLSFLTLLAAIITLTIGCSEESDCSMTARPYMVSNFYRYGASKNVIIKDTLDFLTVKAIDTDSILLNAGEKISSFNAPLRFQPLSEEMTGLVFEFDNEGNRKDTMWVTHTNSVYFVSIDCGQQVKQKITNIRHTKHRIDQIILTNPEANNYDKENIKIILR
ncbi:DUF6452 family protein [Bacteroides propionicifaciens]|jgi:hypothetical protein|uniref:DUF6452 family protein n=1 Tax=Bacteroides propionicifaciens TaxID=392838 RepID=UPI000380821C|nr:DUF6452 family protein [Bacteroides propionicifaciens]